MVVGAFAKCRLNRWFEAGGSEEDRDSLGSSLPGIKTLPWPKMTKQLC